MLYQFFVCNPFNPQPLISHLTNSNGYGNLTPGSVDVSTLGTLLFPEPNMYPKLSHFGPPFVFNGLRTLYLSCGSFSSPDRLFSIACALFDKNTGGGIPPSSPLPHLRPLLPSHPLSVSTFRINTCESVSKQTTSSPFRINTYEKTGEGAPVAQVRLLDLRLFLTFACSSERPLAGWPSGRRWLGSSAGER